MVIADARARSPESFHVSPRSRGAAPAHGRDRGTGAGTDARGVGQRAPPRDNRVADGLRQAHDPRPLLPEVPGAEDAARGDPIHPPVSRATHLENLAGCRGPADGRPPLGALGDLGTLTNGILCSLESSSGITPPSAVDRSRATT